MSVPYAVLLVNLPDAASAESLARDMLADDIGVTLAQQARLDRPITFVPGAGGRVAKATVIFAPPVWDQIAAARGLR